MTIYLNFHTRYYLSINKCAVKNKYIFYSQHTMLVGLLLLPLQRHHQPPFRRWPPVFLEHAILIHWICHLEMLRHMHDFGGNVCGLWRSSKPCIVQQRLSLLRDTLQIIGFAVDVNKQHKVNWKILHMCTLCAMAETSYPMWATCTCLYSRGAPPCTTHISCWRLHLGEKERS